MKVKVPSKIKIGVHAYEVRYNPLLWHEESLKGCANHLRQTIEIDTHLAESQKLVTFLHEVNHIINDNYRCKLDEDEIDKMASGFAELLVNNLGIEFVWSDIKELKYREVLKAKDKE